MFPKGLYVLIIDVPSTKIAVGRLGELEFSGRYGYVGSNQSGGRIKRHLKKGKVKRWHIDYLTEIGKVVSVVTMELGKGYEEDLARRLSKKFEFIKNFGNSDCKDDSHLFLVSDGFFEEINKFVQESSEIPKTQFFK